MDILKITWSSPSNIALIKYWGKFPGQIPANPSISYTLSKSLSVMKVEAVPSNKKQISLDFFFEGSSHLKFKEKILKVLETKLDRFPWLLDFHLKIESSNTFPHSSGIASSASSMSALNLCLLSLDEKISGHTILPTDFYKEVSDLSRQASGSAGRSVYPFMASWGEIDTIPNSSNLFASPVNKNEVHEVFHDYCDSILIVDSGEKSVSSRAGHALMDHHPFNNERFKLARQNMIKLLEALKSGDMKSFIEIVEEEALMLHALMMTSQPSYILLRPASLLLIEKIREFREAQKIPVCFTIDAGPNIHLLYPAKHKNVVSNWLTKEFADIKVIHDEVGMGPVLLKD